MPACDGRRTTARSSSRKPDEVLVKLTATVSQQENAALRRDAVRRGITPTDWLRAAVRQALAAARSGT